MLKLLWPLQKVNLRIPGWIWRGTRHFVDNNTSIILPGDKKRGSCNAGRRWTIFGAKLEAWSQNKWFKFFTFQSDMVFEIVNPYWCKVNAISSEKSCLSYIDVWTVKFFPPAESWLVNSNFPRADLMQGEKYQNFSFYYKFISSSHAVKILFLSFTCEDIGVAIVTKMITIAMVT